MTVLLTRESKYFELFNMIELCWPCHSFTIVIESPIEFKLLIRLELVIPTIKNNEYFTSYVTILSNFH